MTQIVCFPICRFIWNKSNHKQESRNVRFLTRICVRATAWASLFIRRRTPRQSIRLRREPSSPPFERYGLGFWGYELQIWKVRFPGEALGSWELRYVRPLRVAFSVPLTICKGIYFMNTICKGVFFKGAIFPGGQSRALGTRYLDS